MQSASQLQAPSKHVALCCVIKLNVRVVFYCEQSTAHLCNNQHGVSHLSGGWFMGKDGSIILSIELTFLLSVHLNVLIKTTP